MSARYRDGREVGKPAAKAPTPVEINTANREYWSRPEPHLKQVIDVGVEMERICERARERAKRAQGGKARAANLREDNAKRNAKIIEAHKNGKSAAVIARSENLTASTVRRIIAARR